MFGRKRAKKAENANHEEIITRKQGEIDEAAHRLYEALVENDQLESTMREQAKTIRGLLRMLALLDVRIDPDADTSTVWRMLGQVFPDHYAMLSLEDHPDDEFGLEDLGLIDASDDYNEEEDDEESEDDDGEGA